MKKYRRYIISDITVSPTTNSFHRIRCYNLPSIVICRIADNSLAEQASDGLNVAGWGHLEEGGGERGLRLDHFVKLIILK